MNAIIFAIDIYTCMKVIDNHSYSTVIAALSAIDLALWSEVVSTDLTY